MSQNLFWRPRKGWARVGSFPLREAVRKRGDTLSLDDQEYLSGLRDGNVEGAEELLEALERYGEIDIKIE